MTTWKQRKLSGSGLHNSQGSTLVVVALCALALIGSVGITIDAARSQMISAKLQSAVDAAGLAAGASIDSEDMDKVARKYVALNFSQGTLGARLGRVTTTLSDDRKRLIISAEANLSTTITRILGRTSVDMASAAEITRSNRGLELVLVLDNTGSMSQPAGGGVSKLRAAKRASISLLDALYGDARTVPNLWVGIVPFSQAVNIGTANTAWLDNAVAATTNYGPVATPPIGGGAGTCSVHNGVTGTYNPGPKCTYILPAASPVPNFHLINWDGCVEARGNGMNLPQYDITDDPPTVKPFKPYYYAHGVNNNLWYSTSDEDCSGGSVGRCIRSHEIHTTCTTTYPACCPANAESCTNPPNCGRPPSKRPCKQEVCDERTPSVPPVCTKIKYVYDYSIIGWLGAHKGPNVSCPQPVQPMVADKNVLISSINNMVAVGQTEINLGLAWGWRMLSPRWRGLWGGEMDANDLPLDYRTPLMTKAVILMTDGDNTIVSGDYGAYGVSTSSAQLGVAQCAGGNCANGIAALNARTSAVCTMMKRNGIVIYTIALGRDINQNSKTMLSNCASNPDFFFLSPTTDDLQGVFQRIADSLANLRISR